MLFRSGNNAYQFQVDEAAKQKADTNYSIKTAIEVVIKLSAEQSTGKYPAKDVNFYTGKEFIIDLVTGTRCDTIGGTCVSTYALENDSIYSNGLTGEDAKGDSTVTLLPSLDLNEADFFNLNANVVTRVLKMENITNIISNDTKKSFYQETGFDEVDRKSVV